jgi:hypothetical protein
MGKSKHGKIEGPFLPLLNATMDSPAWLAMSHGAKWLYVALKRKSNSGPRAYLSYRDAMGVCKAGRQDTRVVCRIAALWIYQAAHSWMPRR